MKTFLISLISVLSLFAVFGCGGSSGGGMEGESSEDIVPPSEISGNRIIFFGDSLTEGYHLPQSQAYPALIRQLINQAGLTYTVVNAGVSGETSAGGLQRIDTLDLSNLHLFFLALGTNDWLRELDLEQMKENLQGILNKVNRQSPNSIIVIAGLKVLKDRGNSEFQARFSAIFRELAEEKGATLVPMFLDGVAGVESLNISDGIHPTAEGQKIIAQNVWKVLQPLLVI